MLMNLCIQLSLNQKQLKFQNIITYSHTTYGEKYLRTHTRGMSDLNSYLQHCQKQLKLFLELKFRSQL